MQIDTAQSGKQALEKTLTTEYQIIFLDHLMPEMDGIECLHAIRSQDDMQEASGAYKDIEEVIANELDLVKVKTRLLPVAVIKG